MHPSAASRIPRSSYALDERERQQLEARQRGPADESTLEQLAQFADQQSDRKEWTVGYYTAERLRMLARALGTLTETPSTGAGQETIESLRAHADNGGVFLTQQQCLAMANLIVEYETSLAYSLRRLEGRDEEVQQLQRAVGDLAEEVEQSENDCEPIVFFFAFEEEAPADAMGIELALELVSLLDVLDPSR